MKKEFVTLLLALVLVIGVMPVAASAGSQFSDMPEDWSTQALENAVENGLLKGSSGKVMPNANLTRAEMATIINRSFGAAGKASLAEYIDVSADAWYYDEMAKAVQMKTFQGSGSELNPDDPITREEAFAVLSRAFKLGSDNNVPAGFVDLNEISNWAKGEVYSLINAEYIQGSNGFINPKNNISRAEFAQVMFNIVKGYISEAGEYTELPEGNIMVNVAGVTLKDLVVSGDLIVGDGVGDGDLILDNVTIEGRLVVRGGGANSIIIRGNSNVGKVIVAKVDGAVRVYTEDGATVEAIHVEDGKDDVIIEGTVGDVVLKSETPVVLQNAVVENVTVEAPKATLTVDKGTKVGSIVVNEEAEESNVYVEGTVASAVVEAPATTITGNGTVEKVTVESTSSDTKIATPNTTVTVEEGAKGVTGTGGVEIPEGTKAENSDDVHKEAKVEDKKEDKPKSSGGGGGGGSSGGSSGGGVTRAEAKKEFLGKVETALPNNAKLSGEDFTVTFNENVSPSTVLQTANGLIGTLKGFADEGVLKLDGTTFELTETIDATDVARAILGGDDQVRSFLTSGNRTASYTADVTVDGVTFSLSGTLTFTVNR